MIERVLIPRASPAIRVIPLASRPIRAVQSLAWRPSWQPFWRRRRVLITCPSGHPRVVDHEVAEDGTVSPSLVCPQPGCGWHVHARLAGWAGWDSDECGVGRSVGAEGGEA